MPEYLVGAKWKNLIMANYVVDPDLLKPFVPPGTELELFHGKAYVSLVGMLFANTRVLGIPLPRLGTFEELGLRFYVSRQEKGFHSRGVVYLSSIVPYKWIARVVNRFFLGNCRVRATHHVWTKDSQEKQITYLCRKSGHWNMIKAHAQAKPAPIPLGSKEEFILDHYRAYARISDQESLMYTVDHPRWMMHEVSDYIIDCPFGKLFGEPFAFLEQISPESVMLSRGSEVRFRWKKEKIRA